MPLKKRSVGSAPSATDEAPRLNAPGTIIAELNVLKPLPTVINDDSPVFTLVDVVVLGKDGNEPVNLLHAETEGPFRVRGTLVLDKKQKAEYMLPNKKLLKHAVIELDDCAQYAIQNSPANIWAAGKAGWYEIHPAPEYEEMYNHMMEGIDMFYSLEDMHTDEADNNRRVPLHVDLLVLEWIVKRGLKFRADAVKAIWLDHAKFLIDQMIRSNGDVLWSSTPLYAWLAKSVPDIYKLYHSHGYVKTYPNPSSKPHVFVEAIHEVMDANPSRHWTIDTLCKAITPAKLGLKSADQAKEHIEVNAAAILQRLDDKYLGSSVAHYLLEKATERELEQGDEFTAADDIEPGINSRAKAENLRRERATARTVVDLMHNLAASGEMSVQQLSIESVASELYTRYTVKSEPAAVELIKSASSAITAAIAQWGLKYIHTPICKELCWVSQRRIDFEKLEEEARNFEVTHSMEETQDEYEKVVHALQEPEERRARTISLFVTEMLDCDELTFSEMTIDALAEKMARYLAIDGEGFAKLVLRTNSEPIYSIMDLKYARTPLREELIKASVDEVMIMDKSAAEQDLKPRAAMRKPSKRTESISEHVTRAARRQSEHSDAQPTPRWRSTIVDREMSDVHTPTQRHPAGKGAGKASTRRPVGTPLLPLKRVSDDEDASPTFGSPKRRKIGGITPNGEVKPSVSFASRTYETTPEPEPESDILYETDDSDSTTGAYETVLEAVDMGQTESPNGPDGLWTCEREGCETVIANADEAEGRERVRRHFLWHADEVEARWNLVKAAERPYLPVENLLRHFERVGRVVREGEMGRDVVGGRVPKPLQRAGF